MKISNKFILKEKNNKLYLLVSGQMEDVLYEFEDTGYEILKLISKSYSKDEIVQALMDKYPLASPEELSEDVSDFISELLEEGILEVEA